MNTVLKVEGVHNAALQSVKGQARAKALLEKATRTGRQVIETFEVESMFLLVVNGKVVALAEKGEVLEGEIASPMVLTVAENPAAWVSGRRPAVAVAGR